VEFGFRENPFLDVPDLRFTYRHRIFQDVSADLMFVRMSDRRGIALIEGPVGSGKTTLLATLDDNRKPGEASVTLSAHRRLTVAKMIDICAKALGFSIDKDAGPDDLEVYLHAFSRHLGEMTNKGGVILLIDRAEMLSAGFFEDLPRLLALGRDGRAAVHVVLAVTCADDADPLPRAFDVVQDQIHFRSWLGSMSEDEVDRYVAHRMIVAGDSTGKLFSKEGLGALNLYSGGVPGRVNAICRQCIEFLTAEFMQEAGADTVQRAADILGFKPQPRPAPSPPEQEPKKGARGKGKGISWPGLRSRKQRKSNPAAPDGAAKKGRERQPADSALRPEDAFEDTKNVVGLPPRNQGAGQAAAVQARLLQSGTRGPGGRSAAARQQRPAEDPSLALVPGAREKQRRVPAVTDLPVLPDDAWDEDPVGGESRPGDPKQRERSPKATIKEIRSRRPYLLSRLAAVAFVLLLGVVLLGVFGRQDKPDEAILAEATPVPESYAVTPSDTRLTSLEGRVADLADRLTQVQVERDSLVATLSALQLADQEAKLEPENGGTVSSNTGNSLVLDLQRQLTTLGLDPGDRDGQLGRKTLNAIARYQEQQGLKVDRRATRALLDHMQALNHLKQAVVLYHEKDYEAAEAAYDAVVRLQPGDPDARFFRGLARLQLGDTRDAVEDLTWQGKADPRVPIAAFPPALVYFIQERLKALDFDPGRGDGLYDAGTKNAIGAYQRVQGIPYNPDPTRDLLRHLEVYNHHASAIEAYHQGETERALELYDLVLSLRGDDAEAYFNRGLAYRKAGDADKALADYNAAIEQDPSLAKAYYERGNLEAQEGRYTVALADYFSAAKAWVFQD
jgi:general secretion pathway protein A